MGAELYVEILSAENQDPVRAWHCSANVLSHRMPRVTPLERFCNQAQNQLAGWVVLGLGFYRWAMDGCRAEICLFPVNRASSNHRCKFHPPSLMAWTC